jgi:hypothetical protein
MPPPPSRRDPASRLPDAGRGHSVPRDDHALEEEATMARGNTHKDPPADLTALGLQEVEQRLEVSPLITAGASGDAAGPGAADGADDALAREGASCSCKINDPPQPEDGDPDG